MWDAVIGWLNYNTGAVQGAVGLVLLFTLGAVLWYACETRKMRLEMHRPIVDMDLPEPEPGSGKGLKLIQSALQARAQMQLPQFDCLVSNLGLGPALDVEVSIVHELQVFNTGKIGALAKQSKTLVHFQGSARDTGQPNPVGDRIVARYWDVYRHEWKSQREIVYDPENSRADLGPLKVSRA